MRTESPDETRPATTSRRTFLEVAAASAGALLVGFRIPLARAQSAELAPNAFIRIDGRGATTLVMPQAEMGQGVYTSIAMILGEELDVDWQQVKLEHAPPSDALYGNPFFGLQVTGNSNSIRAFWTPLRKAGASTRLMLIEAAASQWGVSASDCRTESGAVIHAATGRKHGYGELAAAASRVAPAADPPLKSRADFRLIGKALKRLDVAGKVDGTAQYVIDVRPPGVKFATLAASPVLGGKVKSVDDSRTKQVAGVRQVVVLDDLVAVVADNMWAAKQGLGALAIVWDEGPNAAVDSELMRQQLRAASEKTGVTAKSVGDAAAALARGERVDATYELPLLAHAQLEPVSCTAHVRADACDVWAGTQVQTRAHAAAVRITGLPSEKVTLHNHLLGGAFGRKLEVDDVEKTVRIAKEVDGPVKVVWTREEDMQHDIYRPMYHDRLAASLSDGRIVAWTHRVTGPSILARWLPPAFTKGIDGDAVDGAVDIPYDIPNLRVEYVRHELPAVTIGFWRGVGPNNNVFAVESFVDEIAAKAGRDPVELRRELLRNSPRLLAALNLAAERAGWGTPLPPRTGRGIAAQVSFGSFIATVAEVEVDGNGAIRVRRMVTAVDTGIVVNPDTVVAQLQGGINFGLTAALYGEITVERGRVKQSNFHDYRLLRMNEAPQIDVHLIDSGEGPGGIGEAGTNAGPAALGNAIFAATGVRIRRLPIDPTLLATGKRPS
jgi:isoquinoline 1-oxidoreductase beta subunit